MFMFGGLRMRCFREPEALESLEGSTSGGALNDEIDDRPEVDDR